MKKYPKIILGEDKFTGWFKKCENNNFANEAERAQKYLAVLNVSHELGVRGFSISPQQTLVAVLKKFKSVHPEIICIANPHFKSNYYLNGQSLWNSVLLERINQTSEVKFGLVTDESNILTEIEIAQINLNIKEYKQQLAIFSQFCDFCLVGNLGFSCLQALDRLDIIQTEIDLVRNSKMSPLGICEAGGYCLEKMKNLNVDGFWLKINEDYQLPNRIESLKIIGSINKPITAYKIFSSKFGFNLDESVDFIAKIPEIKSLVIGIENKEQAQETFTRLNAYF